MDAMVSTRALVGLLLVASLWSATHNIAVAVTPGTFFLLPDGDNVTCIPIASQASLAAGNITYNRYPTTVITVGNDTSDSRGALVSQQTISLVADGCLDGTIPVKSSYVQGQSARVPHTKTTTRARSSASQTTISVPHEYGNNQLDSSLAPGPYKGTELFINIWQPFVANSQEFSLGQLAVASGSSTMEAGNQIYSVVGGDNLPRLFVYWTADGYVSTGCYDLGCPGFVQVSNIVLLGGSFAGVSSVSGQQYEIKLRVFKDDGTGDWWLQLNDESVGYWPKDIYSNNTFVTADTVLWYGEIIDDEPVDGNLHTTTQMGSGHFAEEGQGTAAYMRNLQYIDQTNSLVDAPFISGVTNASCYSVQKGTDFSTWGSYFYYGGPGLNANCTHDAVYTNP